MNKQLQLLLAAKASAEALHLDGVCLMLDAALTNLRQYHESQDAQEIQSTSTHVQNAQLDLEDAIQSLKQEVADLRHEAEIVAL